MTEPEYTAPAAAPDTIAPDDRPAWLDGHRTGWSDAATDNLGHGTEPPELIDGQPYHESVWLDGWEVGRDAFEASRRS